jgi:RecB family endonuclease NucS
MIVARCSVEYQGRLGARLASAIRLVLLKADGSLAVHSDAKAYKPLNWMNPPCTITFGEATITAATPKGEILVIELEEVFADVDHELGVDPGLEKDGVEAQLQELLAADVTALEPEFSLIKREYFTDIGPVDLLCSDSSGRTVAVEIKRVGEIAGVEQLLRYLERLDRDTRFAPTRGMFVAQRFKPQAKVFAESKGIVCVEVDLDTLRGEVDHLTLF